MKFFSEVTKKLYDSEKALIAAESEVKKLEEEKIAKEKAKKEERAKRAKEVEEALKVANKAQEKAIALLKDFTKDYGYFHMSYSTDDAEKVTNKTNNFDFFELLNSFLQ